MKLSRIILLIFLSLIVVTGLIIFLVLNHSAKSLTDAEKEAALVNILGRKPILTNNEATGTVLANTPVSVIPPKRLFTPIKTRTLSRTSRSWKCSLSI